MFDREENKIYLKSIQGAIDGGHMQASIDNKYMYPWRINIFPGTSCMFFCSFCGRNHGSVVDDAYESYLYFKQVIEQDSGKDPRVFGIGGGLEPLTTPYIGEIFKNLHDGGYKCRMLTNAFLLNNKYIKKHEYINSLDHIRVSLYGIDEEEYKNTTKHNKGWHVVKENLKNYNKIENRTKLYLNYILLPSNYKNILKVIDYIDYIGGCDNLSLREDFAFHYEIEERKTLTEYLLKFDTEIKKRGIRVDYGYSLSQLLKGLETKLLRVTSVDQLTKRQSPQVKIALDPRGDIYYYQEAAFIDRPGSDRHILGNIKNSSIEEELKKEVEIEPDINDAKYMDAFNQTVELYKWSKRCMN